MTAEARQACLELLRIALTVPREVAMISVEYCAYPERMDVNVFDSASSVLRDREWLADEEAGERRIKRMITRLESKLAEMGWIETQSEVKL